MFFSFSCVITQETSMEIDFKTLNFIVKNKETTIFHGLCSYILIDNRMTSKYSKLCSETTCLQAVVPLEFLTFCRHFYDR